MQPAGQYPAIYELGGILRERNKHALGDILGEMGIANHAQRDGINEIHVAAHQFGEGRLRAGFGIDAQ